MNEAGLSGPAVPSDQADAALADPRVRAEVVTLLYNNAATGIVMNLIAIPILWVAYRDLVTATPLIGALSLWAALPIASALNRARWNRIGTESQQSPEYSKEFLARARVMAWVLSFGMALLLAVLHFAKAPATPALAAALALVYVLGATTSTLIYAPQVRIFSAVVLGSQALLLLHRGSAVEWLLAALMVALIAGLWAYARRYSSQLQQVIVLRFEVQDLLSSQEHLRNAAEAANEAKSRFFAAASHDVRQPLQAVMLTFHALRHARDEARRKHLLDNAERNLGALRQLFDQVLDISKIDAGAVPIHQQPIALTALFEKLDARFGAEASAKKLWLRFAPTSRIVKSDPDALERMLANLIGNAIKYTERGGVWIGLRSQMQRIEVRDTGVGISSEHHERIFDEFFQVNNPGRDRASGLGLGLSIVRRLASLLKQQVGMRSKPNGGSTFWIEVPVLERATAISREASANAVDVTADALAGAHLFLIENDQQVANALEELLTEAGATVYCFTDAAAALASARTVPPDRVDVVISDYRLDGPTDGAETVLQLRVLWQRPLSAIILTGDTSIRELSSIDARLQTSDETTNARLLHKPVLAPELIAAVRDAHARPV